TGIGARMSDDRDSSGRVYIPNHIGNRAPIRSQPPIDQPFDANRDQMAGPRGYLHAENRQYPSGIQGRQLRKAGERIVIGEHEEIEIALLDGLPEFLYRPLPIGVMGMHMQVTSIPTRAGFRDGRWQRRFGGRLLYRLN